MQAFTNGEIDLAWGWNDAAFQTAAKQGLPLKMKRDTKEGLSTWVCGYVHAQGRAGQSRQRL